MNKNNYKIKLDLYNKGISSDHYNFTQGFGKLFNYIEEIFRSENFLKEIDEIRIKYGIPEEGFLSKKFPQDWKFKGDIKTINKIEKTIKSLCDRYRLSSQDWLGTFEYFLIYNKVILFHKPCSYNLCRVTDLIKKKNIIDHPLTNNLIKTFPIALQISPYASERDILDYVKRLYTAEISPMQKIYREKLVKIGKYKSKRLNIKLRNDFIYKYRDLPRKELYEKIKEKFDAETFGGIDRGNLGKIISLEIKRRKDL